MYSLEAHLSLWVDSSVAPLSAKVATKVQEVGGDISRRGRMHKRGVRGGGGCRRWKLNQGGCGRHWGRRCFILSSQHQPSFWRSLNITHHWDSMEVPFHFVTYWWSLIILTSLLLASSTPPSLSIGSKCPFYQTTPNPINGNQHQQNFQVGDVTYL